MMLLIYSGFVLWVLVVCNRVSLAPGVVAATLGLASNVAGLVFGYEIRAFAVPVVFVGGLLATKSAFASADELPPGDEPQRATSQAAMALLGMTIAEALLLLVIGFVWYVSSSF